jgi:hypothetical protein
MKLEEKIKAFNLLPITAKMVSYLEEAFPEYHNFDSLDFVKFHQSTPYFYSKWFIENKTFADLLQGFTQITGEVLGEIGQRPDNAKSGIPDGTMFNCPSCVRTVIDAWVTRASVGGSVKCPFCKQGFVVITSPDETNMVSVQS